MNAAKQIKNKHKSLLPNLMSVENLTLAILKSTTSCFQ